MDTDEYDPLLAADQDEASAGDAVPTPAKAPAADDKASEVPKEKESEGQSSPSEETKKMVREDGCSSTAPKQLDAETAAAEEGGALGPAVQVGQAVAQAMEGSASSSGIKEGTEVAEDEAAKQQPVVEKSETAPASAEGAASNKQECAVEHKVNGASRVALQKAAASEGGSGDLNDDMSLDSSVEAAKTGAKDDMSLDSSVEAAKTKVKARAERGSEEKERPRVPDPVEAEQMEKARIRAWERDQQRQRRRSREGHAGPHDQEWREYWSRQEGSSSSPGSESQRRKGGGDSSREREQHGGGRSRWDRDRDWRENGYERAMNESARSPASPPPLGKSQGTSDAGGSHVSSAERAGAFEPEDSERRGSTSSRSSSRSRSSERRRERRKKRSRREEERGGDDDDESRDRKRKRRSRRRSGSRSRRHHGKHKRKDRDGRKSSRRTRSPSLVCSPPPASVEGGGAAAGGGGDGYEPEQLSAFPEPPPVPADWNGQSTGAAAPRDPKQESLSEKQRAFFKEVSKVVKKVLKKYLAKEQIGTKEEMENLTRKMSHKILQKEHGNTKMTKDTPVKIAKYIKGYFDKHGFYGVRPTA